MALPKTPEARQKLYRFLCEAVEFMKEVDTLKDDINNVKGIIKEEFDIPAAEITMLIQALYDDSKLSTEIEKREEALANIEIITKVEE